MIQANELMLGNIIVKDDVVCSVKFISEDIISADDLESDNTVHGEPGEFMGIVLTEAILFAIGMKKGIFEQQDFFHNDINNFELDVVDGFLFFDGNRIDFLHELQNIYKLSELEPLIIGAEKKLSKKMRSL